MKKCSITTRVTFWYTSLIVSLLILNFLYLIALFNQLSGNQLQETLIDSVTDTIQAAKFNYGKLEDEDIDFYHQGVSVFLYDSDGRLLAPKVNRGIQIDSVLEDQTLKTAYGTGEQWMIYDLYAVQDETGFWVRGVIPLSGKQKTIQNMILLAAIGIPLLALFAALGGWLITKHAFGAVSHMAKAADAITSGNDLSRRLPANHNGDELARLASTINSMLERLQSSFENEKQFTSDVSHELRTPTSVILSHCEYALSKQANEADKEEALTSILIQSKRMSSMISQLLLLARADHGKFKPRMEQINLTDLCEMTAMEMNDLAKNSNIKLYTNLEPEVIITGDETLLIRLITNLLSNAIHYNVPYGNIRLNLRSTADTCYLEVADSGIGISKEDLPKIWNRFYRADTSRSHGGTGLGLSMVDWIVKLHHGNITITSEPGKGSSFVINLPKH